MEIWSFLGTYQGILRRLLADSTRQTSPNDKNKRLDSLVWNQTEQILMPAEADVLEVFDW